MQLPFPLPPQAGSGAPPPGMPAGPTAAPGGTGPAMTPGPMAGATQHGAAGVKTALELLQKALPTIAMGGKMHTAVLKAVTDLSKAMMDDPAQQGGDPSAIIQQLMAAQKAQQAQPNSPPPGMPNMGPGPMPAPPGGPSAMAA